MADAAFIRAALEKASPNVLRLAISQATGDPELLELPTVQVPIRGGAFFLTSLSEECAEVVRKRAFEHLTAGALPDEVRPSAGQLRALMENFSGRELTDLEFRMGSEELALDDFPREVAWPEGVDRDAVAARVADHHVSIIGAGIGGLATAIQLRRLGIPFTIFERQDEIGGVWATNVYPDVRVDTNSFFYQFSFEKNYPWSEFYAGGPETRTYLQHVAERHGVADRIRLGHEVLEATWDESSSTWQLKIDPRDGEAFEFSTRYVVSASGLFSTPKVPDIPGIDTFSGPMSHTAQWDGSVQAEGKDVALIGNGSTGVQILPYLARTGRTVTVFQRTPSWMSSLDGYRDKVTPEVQWLFDHVPFYWNWYCYSFFAGSSGMQDAESFDEEWINAGGQISPANDELRASMRAYIEEKLASKPELIEVCTPRYAPLGRRPVVDNGWYDALVRDNVTLVSEPIDHIEADAIVTRDGTRHAVDAIVMAAGFEVERYFSPVDYRGRRGATLDGLWEVDGPRSYLGVTMPGFPNLFTIYGPNASPRAGGYYTWAELWARYIVSCIVEVIARDEVSIEVRKDVYDDYNTRLDAAMKGLIWESESTGGYYVNAHGRVGVKMPWRVEEYYEWIASPDLDNYQLA